MLCPVVMQRKKPIFANAMGIVEVLLIAIGVSMDAFAVSVAKGISARQMKMRYALQAGLWFGGFQALMPLLGYFLGSLFAKQIEAVDHWIAFALLSLIGINMLRDAFSKNGCDCCDEKNADFSVKTMFTMAIATSIDALAIGVSLSLAGGVNIWSAILIIGITTCILSAIGVKIGSIFGDKFEKKAQVFGGTILIILAFKILLEHLGVLNF